MNKQDLIDAQVSFLDGLEWALKFIDNPNLSREQAIEIIKDKREEIENDINE